MKGMPLIIATKRNKMPHNKFNQGSERHLQWELQNALKAIDEETNSNNQKRGDGEDILCSR